MTRRHEHVTTCICNPSAGARKVMRSMTHPLPSPKSPRRARSPHSWCVCAILVAALLPNLKAADPETGQLDLTYRSAIERALTKNFQIKIEKFTPKIAKAQQLSASGEFDPVLDLSYSYDENRRDLRSLDPTFDSGSPDSPDTDRFAQTTGTEFDATVTGLTPWGLSYDIGTSITRDTDSRSIIDERYNTFVGASIVQPLLRNFGTDVNLAQIRIARADRSISAWTLRQTIIDVVTDTVSVYNDLYFSIETLKVEIRSRDLAQQTLRDNQRRAEIGVMSPLDVVQAQADVADREERVLVAERAVKDNENFLKQLVTDDISTILDRDVQISAPPFDLDVKIDEKADLLIAFELRPDYRQFLLELQKQNINLVFTRNQALPQLDLVASLGLNGLDTSLGGSVSELKVPSVLDTAVGVNFSLPIPNRTARGNLEISKLEIAQSIVGLKQLEQSIFVEVDNAAGQIETTRKRIDTSRAARIFAQRTLEAGQARLAAGTATTFEVLQFQRDLAESETAEIQALTDHQKAIAEYARVTGTTLDRNRIRLE